MKKNITENIALTIVRAQACSDAGKGIYQLDLYEDTDQKLIEKKYVAKDEQILKAIHIICRLTAEIAGVKFEVVEDTSGIADFLVYFTYYLNGMKRQISFHSFSAKLEKFCRKKNTVRWDHGNSRGNCEELIDYFGF